jgi:hypothetical protein
MYLLYMDWNVMGSLRGTPTGGATKLAAFLEQYRDRFWIPYSSTHLDDLARGYDPTDAQKVKYTYADLSLIHQLTKDECFQTYHGQDRPTPDQRDPVEFFESHYEEQQGAKEVFSSILAPADGPLDGFDLMRTLMLSLPAIPFPEEAQGTFIAQMFPGWSSQGALGSMLEDFGNLLRRANTDYTYSTELRDLVRKGLPMLNPSVVSTPTGDAFAHIDKLLLPFTGGVSVIDMLGNTLKNPTNPDQPPTLFNKFVHYYYLLDLFGFHPEKLKPKNHFPNLLGDATHAFLAGHCDFLITNDKDLRHKAKAVYQKLPTRTLVFSVDEFLVFVESGLASYTPKTYPDYIAGALRDGVLPSSTAEQKPAVPSWVLPYSLFDLFNAFELRTSNSVTFLRVEVTYRYFTLPDVMVQLVGFLYTCLGPDDKEQGELETAVEIRQMNTNTWAGRKWSGGGNVTQLTCIDGEPELTIAVPIHEDTTLAL